MAGLGETAMITESLRFTCKYPNTKLGTEPHMLVVTRNDEKITLELTRHDQRVAAVELPAILVGDEITPSSTGYLWTVWVDEIAVRVGENDKTAIERMIQRAIAGAEPAL